MNNHLFEKNKESEVAMVFKKWFGSVLTKELAKCEHSADGRQTIKLAKQLMHDPDLSSDFEECKNLATNYKNSQTKTKHNYFKPIVASAFALILGVFCSVLYMQSPDSYRAKIGEQRTIVLDDQSKITLNTDTSVRVKYSTDARMVWLDKGEAYFQVTPDQSRPFKVLAGKGLVRAVGTAFSVGIKDNQISVAVLEGSVDVLAHNEDVALQKADISNQDQTPEKLVRRKTHLKVGEAVRFWSNGVMGNVEVAETLRINAWREGKLRFKNLPLVDAIDEHNRYTQQQIVLGSEDIRFLKISGVFEIGDTDSLLFLLEASLGLSSVKQSNVIVLLPQSKLHTVQAQPENHALLAEKP